MRKNITTALFCALTFGATQAQEALIQSEDIFVIPGAITANGKPVFASLDEENGVETIKIYDENFNVSKTISRNVIQSTSKRWEEMAIVTITGLKQTDISTNTTPIGSEVDLSNVKTGVQLANALNQYYGYDSNPSEKYIGFTDSEGFPGCYINNDGAFNYPEYFGHDYLRYYYRLQNGIVYSISVSYSYTYDEESADWQQSSSVTETANYHGLYSFWFEDFDGGSSSDDESIYCSQTLFNDDSSWEFIVPIVEERINQGDAWTYGSTDGDKVTLKRTCSSSNYVTGYKVLSENGTEIMTIFLKNNRLYSSSDMAVLHVNGKNYLKIYNDGEYLYSIEKSGTSVKLNEVARRRLANVGNGIIDVNTDGENGQILLTNMAGSTVDRKTARGETVVRLNTRHLAKGVYNVTLQRDGRTVANEKVLVK